MPDIMTAIEAVGQLEAQREITQNQNLLSKPDSVLEYACFEQHVTLSGNQALYLFSEAEWFFQINDPFIDAYSQDRALYTLVFNALIGYLRNNFWHRYLGDRADLEGLPDSGSGAFTCYAMGYVWNRAKCQDFATPRHQQDGFYTFDQYANMSNDPRDLPNPQTCPMWTEWVSRMETANRLNAPIAGDPTGNREDPLVLYREFFDADSCGPPIPTGLYAAPFPGAEVEGFDEFVCVNPGCYYNGSTCVNG